MANINELRQLAKRRRQAATAKIARQRRVNGVEIAGTEFDPRLPPGAEAKMNSRQLRSYLNRVDRFTSRQTQFVPGDSGVPIPADRWRVYKGLETAYKKAGEADMKAVGSMALPKVYGEMTLEQRMNTVVSKRITADGSAVNRPYMDLNRQSTNIKDAKALEKLIADMGGKTSAKYLPKKLKEGRKQLDDMMKIIGDKKLRAKARKLTDYQFNALWNYTKFATDVGQDYDVIKAGGGSPKEQVDKTIHDNANYNMERALEWAAAIEEAKPTAKRGKKR